MTLTRPSCRCRRTSATQAQPDGQGRHHQREAGQPREASGVGRSQRLCGRRHDGENADFVLIVQHDAHVGRAVGARARIGPDRAVGNDEQAPGGDVRLGVAKAAAQQELRQTSLAGEMTTGADIGRGVLVEQRERAGQIVGIQRGRVRRDGGSRIPAHLGCNRGRGSEHQEQQRPTLPPGAGTGAAYASRPSTRPAYPCGGRGQDGVLLGSGT